MLTFLSASGDNQAGASRDGADDDRRKQVFPSKGDTSIVPLGVGTAKATLGPGPAPG